MITEKDNLELWEKLHQQWVKEGRPKFLAVGMAHYEVHQLYGTNEIAFKSRDSESMYKRTSMEGMN
jgi:hypothetical protein